MNWGRLTLTLVCSLVVVACGAGTTTDSQAPSSVATQATTTAADAAPADLESTTTTLDPTAAGTPRPIVNQEAETWAEMLLVFHAADHYLRWLGAHPTNDESVLASVLDPNGPEHADQLTRMRERIDAGTREVGVGFGLIYALSCCSEPETRLHEGELTVVFRTDTDGPSSVTLDEAGSVVAESETWNAVQFRVEFRRNIDEQWLVWEITRSQPTRNPEDLVDHDGGVGTKSDVVALIDEIYNEVGGDAAPRDTVPFPDVTHPDPIVALGDMLRFNNWMLTTNPVGAWGRLYGYKPTGFQGNVERGMNVRYSGGQLLTYEQEDGSFSFDGAEIVPIESIGDLPVWQAGAIPDDAVGVIFTTTIDEFNYVGADGELLEEYDAWDTQQSQAILVPTSLGWRIAFWRWNKVK